MDIHKLRKQQVSKCLVCGKKIEGLKIKKFCSWSCLSKNKYHRLKNNYDDISKALTPFEEIIISFIEKNSKDNEVLPYKEIADALGIDVNQAITNIAKIKAKGYLQDRY